MVHEPNYHPLPQRGCIRLSWSQLAQNQLSFQEFVLEGAMEARRALAASGEACAVLCCVLAGVTMPELVQWVLGKALPAGGRRAVLLAKAAAGAECRS